MSNQPQQTVIVQQAPGTSTLGIIALIFSVLGWFTCGLLCIPGAIFGVLGLFSKKPKGLAIAALVVGFPGTIFFFVAGLGMLLAAIGVGGAAVDAASKAAAEVEAQRMAEGDTDELYDALGGPVDPIELPSSTEPEDPADEMPTENAGETGAHPDPVPLPETTPKQPVDPEPEPEPEPEPAVDPKTVVRTFSDASGNFTVEATVDQVDLTAGTIKLKRQDNNKIATVPIDKLSVSDQEWIQKNFGN